MPAGRPSAYDPAYCERLIDHMSQGLSFETFGAKIGVSKQTLYTWVKQHPEFLDAKEAATQLCQLFWEEMGISGAIAGSAGINASVWIFNMKNRFGWRDKRDVELTGMKPTIIKRRNGDEVELGLRDIDEKGDDE